MMSLKQETERVISVHIPHKLDVSQQSKSYSGVNQMKWKRVSKRGKGQWLEETSVDIGEGKRDDEEVLGKYGFKERKAEVQTKVDWNLYIKCFNLKEMRDFKDMS